MGLQGSYRLLMRLFKQVVEWGVGEAKIVPLQALICPASAA